MEPIFPDPEEITQSVKQIMTICRLAWEKGFMAGWSGNASIRLSKNPQILLITSSGSAKGLLETDDCLLINLKGEKLSGKAKASSESGLHTILYESLPEASAILHTHPPYLQALELSLSNEKTCTTGFLMKKLLNINLHEALIWRKHLRFAENYPPGSSELAESAATAIMEDKKEPSLPLAIWLPQHGLCTMAENLKTCLCLTEEIEHLAQVQLLSRQNQNRAV